MPRGDWNWPAVGPHPTHHIIRGDRRGNPGIRVDRLGDGLGDGAIRPEFGDNILADIEGHRFGSAPIREGIGISVCRSGQPRQCNPG